jgi:hypothetical protein
MDMISVLVPTRDRCDTLVATLRTCMDQDYDRCEFIVSDNLSQDGTQDHVRSLRDSRIRYLRTGRRLGMSQNWDFALAHAKGEYVTILGDDDALLPGALVELAEFLRHSRADALTWKAASYFWPNSIHPSARNLLFVPRKGPIEVRAARTYLQQVLNFKRGYDELPVIYKGIARTQLVRGIGARSGGSFFQSLNPDLYSAIALSLNLGEYHYSPKSYSINGTSGHSNSASQMHPSLSDSAANTFMSEENIPFHGDLVFAPCMTLQVAESFLQARDRFPSEAARFTLDMKLVLEQAMSEVSASDRVVYERTCDAVRAIARLHRLAPMADALVSRSVHREKPSPIALEPGYNVIHRHHIVDCSKLGVRDIHQAAAVCKTVAEADTLGLMRDPGAIAGTTLALAKGFTTRIYRRLVQSASTS